jgi:putative ABC transport system ATP-binding protein
MEDWVIETRDLKKVYRMGSVEVQALAGVSFTIRRGEVVSIMGPSGSGKSTLMNLLGCLDRPTSGSYILDGEQVANLNSDQLASIRSRKVGFVFQSFNLLPRATALSNVELPMRYAGIKKGRIDRAKEALASVGLADRMYHRPTEMSGGQQQRVAVARALVARPPLVLADEPTGNLDTRSADQVFELLRQFNQEFRGAFVVVTHDPRLAHRCDRIVEIVDGGIRSDSRRDAGGPAVPPAGGDAPAWPPMRSRTPSS